MIFRKYRAKIIEKIKSIKKSMMWNGAIRSVTISYMGIALTTSRQFKMWMRGSEYQDSANLYIAGGMLAYLILLPFAAFVFLKKNHKDLDTPEMRAKCVNLYADVHVVRSDYEIYYYPLFLFRKLFIIMLPALFARYPFL